MYGAGSTLRLTTQRGGRQDFTVAAIPAIRAARTDVLRAIAYE
jgi:hypothetical protein